MNVTMDDATYATLPDRQALTGSPLPECYYRDPAHPGLVFEWYDGRHGDRHQGGWQAFKWERP